MAHAQVAAQVHVLAQRQHTARAQYPPVADDDRAVVHGRFYEEDVFQQLGGHGGIQHCAAANHVVQADVTLEHDENAGLALGHLAARDDRLVDGRLQRRLLLHRAEGFEYLDVAAAHLLQYLPYLRLEQDDDGDDAHLHQVAHDVGHGVQLQHIGDAQRQQEHDHALEDILRTGAFHQPQQTVYQKGDDRDVQNVREAYQD